MALRLTAVPVAALTVALALALASAAAPACPSDHPDPSCCYGKLACIRRAAVVLTQACAQARGKAVSAFVGTFNTSATSAPTVRYIVWLERVCGCVRHSWHNDYHAAVCRDHLCNSHGICDETSNASADENGVVQGTCKCDGGWEGERCTANTLGTVGKAEE